MSVISTDLYANIIELKIMIFLKKKPDGYT